MAESWMRELRYEIARLTAAETSLFGYLGPDAAEALNGRIGIYSSTLPEHPDEACALALTTITNRPVTIIGAQFRLRAESDGRLDDMQDAIENCWHDRWGGTLGSIRLVSAEWASGTSLGNDQNERPERVVNVNLTVHRPLAHRTT